jgi:hypothetical protein
MADLRQFAQSMNNLGNRIERRGPEVQRLVALEILRQVIFGTPVGNKEIWLEPGKARVGYVGGRARANWFVGIGIAPAGTTEAIDAGGGQALQAGADLIRTSTPGLDIHLTNNLPYIVPLNQGHSHQAPAGFIERAIQIGTGLLASTRLTEEGSPP